MIWWQKSPQNCLSKCSTFCFSPPNVWWLKVWDKSRPRTWAAELGEEEEEQEEGGWGWDWWLTINYWLEQHDVKVETSYCLRSIASSVGDLSWMVNDGRGYYRSGTKPTMKVSREKGQIYAYVSNITSLPPPPPPPPPPPLLNASEQNRSVHVPN